MSKSRRAFIKLGTLATLFAALPFRNVLGQDWKSRDGNPGNTPVAQGDPLANYSKEAFRSYLNSVFQVHTAAGIVETTLVEVADMPSSPGGECFSLLFRGGARPNRQDTYTIVHASLGTFQLFLVPVAADQNGAQGYLATLNRLSPAEAGMIAAPTKGVGSNRPAAAPQPAPDSVPFTAPSTTTPGTTPTNSSSVQATSAPAATPKKKPQVMPAKASPHRPKKDFLIHDF